jgi:alpha-tubulin suppressor-like RCC1 family protein
MWCWGGGLNGQLGVGPLNQDNALSPVVVKEGGWRAVAGGQSHTCAIREDRGLYCFGRNDHGQLGVGDVSRRDVPARVGDGAYIRMGLGRNHSCAIREDRTLWCWGRNHVGQLGLGFVSPPDATPIASPRRVCFPPD